MSKHKPSRTHKQAPVVRVAVGLDDAFLRFLEEYNELPAAQRAKALEAMDFRVTDPAVLGILTKSHFVIPGKTRYECQRCGECCRYARKVAQLTYEPCPFLTAGNECAKHDRRYDVCKWFPFWVCTHPVRGKLLTIKPYCDGYGKGKLVDYAGTVERLDRLARSGKHDDDGAFVIHEVLLIPGRRDWAFPSRKNVDELMDRIRRDAMGQTDAPSEPKSRPGEVHHAQQYTSGLLGSANDPTLTINELGMITDVNQPACNFCKQPRERLVGQHFPSLFVNPERVQAGIASCFSCGKETASPHRIRLPDGTVQPVLLDCLVFRDRTDGMVHGALVCMNSVTTAVFTQVSQSRNYARGLIEASLDGLLVIDKDGAINDVNDALISMSGRTREALLGMPFGALFTDQEAARRGVALTFEGGTVHNYELSVLREDGEAIPVSFNAVVYCDSDGVVQGIFAAARDNRERLNLVRALEDAKNYARGLIECSIDLMIAIDSRGFVTDANRAATEATGIPREALIGRRFDTFFADPARAKAGVDRVFADGQVRNYELELVDASARRVRVSFNATLYRDAENEVQGVFAVARLMD